MNISFSPELSACLDALKPNLRKYLELKGIEFNSSQKFKCISPDHDDHSPSASIVINNPEVLHCFSCSYSTNLFGAAKILDKLPTSGPAFLLNTVKSLCAQLGVDFPNVELTSEQRELLDIYRAYELAGEYIANSTLSKPSEYIKSRGWKSEVGFKYGIGHIESFNAFLDYLKSHGYSEAQLNKIGLIQCEVNKTLYYSPIFAPNKVIFNILDHYGNTVAFAARKLDNTDPSEKYRNSSSADPLYHKRELLYGLNLSRKSAIKQGLILVEGYADWITLYEAGITNVAAICGTAFTKEHLQLISNLGINQIYLALDNDNPGHLAVEKILDESLAEFPTLSASIIHLPETAKDPDEYLQHIEPEHRIEMWNSLAKESCFSWRLNRMPDNLSASDVTDKMLPLILTEGNMIKREVMLKELATKTNIRLEALQKQLDIMTETEAMKQSGRVTAIVNSMSRELKRAPSSSKEIISQHLDMIEDLEGTADVNNISASESVEAFDTCLVKWKNINSDVLGLKSGFEEFDKAINGIQSRRSIGIGGKPNHGKSAFMLALAYNVAKINPTALVLYHSTDDPRDVVISRLMAMDQELEINSVTNPKFHFKLASPITDTSTGEIIQWDKDKVDRYNKAKENIRSLISSERFIIKDNTNGSSVSFTESMVKYYRKLYPNKEIVVFVDNLYKASDYGEMHDERLKYKYLSNKIKVMGERYNVSPICSLEYTKADTVMGKKPGMSSFAEAVNLQYDFSILFNLYNELKDYELTDPKKAELVINVNGKKYPIIELAASKTKQSDFLGKLYFYMYPEKALIKPCKADTIIRQIKDSNIRSTSQASRFGNLGNG